MLPESLLNQVQQVYVGWITTMYEEAKAFETFINEEQPDVCKFNKYENEHDVTGAHAYAINLVKEAYTLNSSKHPSSSSLTSVAHDVMFAVATVMQQPVAEWIEHMRLKHLPVSRMQQEFERYCKQARLHCEQHHNMEYQLAMSQQPDIWAKWRSARTFRNLFTDSKVIGQIAGQNTPEQLERQLSYLYPVLYQVQHAMKHRWGADARWEQTQHQWQAEHFRVLVPGHEIAPLYMEGAFTRVQQAWDHIRASVQDAQTRVSAMTVHQKTTGTLFKWSEMVRNAWIHAPEMKDDNEKHFTPLSMELMLTEVHKSMTQYVTQLKRSGPGLTSQLLRDALHSVQNGQSHIHDTPPPIPVEYTERTRKVLLGEWERYQCRAFLDEEWSVWMTHNHTMQQLLPLIEYFNDIQACLNELRCHLCRDVSFFDNQMIAWGEDAEAEWDEARISRYDAWVQERQQHRQAWVQGAITLAKKRLLLAMSTLGSTAAYHDHLDKLPDTPASWVHESWKHTTLFKAEQEVAYPWTQWYCEIQEARQGMLNLIHLPDLVASLHQDAVRDVKLHVSELPSSVHPWCGMSTQVKWTLLRDHLQPLIQQFIDPARGYTDSCQPYIETINTWVDKPLSQGSVSHTWNIIWALCMLHTHNTH
jgi:hypothetical protein